MTDLINGNQRIYLCSHSPEAELLVDSGEAAISTGGIRRPDGTLVDLSKPLSFTLNELKEMVSDDTHLIETDEKVRQLADSMQLSQKGMQEIISIGWLNNTAINQVYAITYSGFKQTLAGLEYISSNMEDFRQYVKQRDFNDLKEKTEKFVSYMESDMQKMELPKFQIMLSNVDEHINEIGSFIKRMYDGLMNGTEEGFFSYAVINALIGPFTNILKKYVVLYFYDNGVAAGFCHKWANLIKEISTDLRFREKIEYYIQLETELSYRDKVALEHATVRRIEGTYNALMFDVEYALYHSKEEYLALHQTIKERIPLIENKSDGENIYL